MSKLKISPELLQISPEVQEALKNKKPPKSGGFLLLVRFAAFPAGCITVVMQARLSGDNTRQ